MSVKDRKCRNHATCGQVIYRDNKTGLCRPCLDESKGYVEPTTPAARVERDQVERREQRELRNLRAKYTDALETIDRQQALLGATAVLQQGLDVTPIVPKYGQGTSEGTVVVLASDWHVEEKVGREVGGLNDYSLDIAHYRGTKFFQAVHRLTRLLQQDIKIETIVLALLGDFISNDIHEEFSDLVSLTPMHALVMAQNMIISGIDFLLNHSTVNLVLPCHSGNHARTTKTTRFSAENGHSLEYLMYLHLATHYRNEARVEFIIPDGYHSYLPVYDQTLRFHHGHAIKYAGGIGGIFIPTYKAISQWEKGRHATLDCFGHFHQMKDGGNFLCNGSLIGYNGFALAIKADYEQPKQTLFLLDKKRGRTCTWPILVK
jgi:hypothetical protein